MTTEQHNTIDFVAHDSTTGTVILVLVEDRPWGHCGERLHDLQAKFNAYLDYIVSGRLEADYPQVAGKRVKIELRSSYPPGARELEFMDIVVRNHFKPEGIDFGWSEIGNAS
jgi:hypothetical protein